MISEGSSSTMLAGMMIPAMPTLLLDMSGKDQVETRSATITRKGDGLVETRFKNDVCIDSEGILENIRSRRELCANEPHVLLTIIPADAEFAATSLSKDLFPDHVDRAQIKAVALVTAGGVPGMMASLYFSCFAELSSSRIFHDEERAREWLVQQLVTSKN